MVQEAHLIGQFSGSDNRAVSKNMIVWTNRSIAPTLGGVDPTFLRLTPTYNQAIGGRTGVMKLSNTGTSTSNVTLSWSFALATMRYMRHTKWKLSADYYIPSTNVQYHFLYPTPTTFLTHFIRQKAYYEKPSHYNLGVNNIELQYQTDTWFTLDTFIDSSIKPNIYTSIFFAYQQLFAAINTESIYIDNIKIEPYFLTNEITSPHDDSHLLPDGITFNTDSMIFNPTVYSHIRDHSGYYLGKISALKSWSIRFKLDVDALSGGDKTIFTSVNSATDQIKLMYRDSDTTLALTIHKSGVDIVALKTDISALSGEQYIIISFDSTSETALAYIGSAAFITDSSPLTIGTDVGFFIGCAGDYTEYLSSSGVKEIYIWETNLSDDDILVDRDGANIFSTWHDNIETLLQSLGLSPLKQATASKQGEGYRITPGGFASRHADVTKLWYAVVTYLVEVSFVISSAKRNTRLKELEDLAYDIKTTFNAVSNYPTSPNQGRFIVDTIDPSYPSESEAVLTFTVLAEGQYSTT